LTAGDSFERDGLLALSQRKLNALGLPLAYIDRRQRYRFVNRAFCDWTAKRAEDVVGREVVEVIGRDVYASTRPTSRPRSPASAPARTPARRAGRPAIWIRVDYYPERSARARCAASWSPTATSTIRSRSNSSGRREHRLRLVTDNVGSPILYFDRQLKVRFANKPFASSVGGAPEDLLGRAMPRC